MYIAGVFNITEYVCNVRAKKGNDVRFDKKKDESCNFLLHSKNLIKNLSQNTTKNESMPKVRDFRLGFFIGYIL